MTEIRRNEGNWQERNKDRNMKRGKQQGTWKGYGKQGVDKRLKRDVRRN